MELKKIDNLLQEFKDVQLSKESMSNINGGGFWDPAEGDANSCCTGSGRLVVYNHPDGYYICYLEGKEMFPHELQRADRTVTAGPYEC